MDGLRHQGRPGLLGGPWAPRARPVHDEVIDRLTHFAAGTTLGPGIDDPDIGSLTTRAQFDRVCSYLALGPQEGASLVVGGRPATEGALGRGLFVEPTIFADVDNSMRVAREEIFGPVLSVLKFSSDEEATDWRTIAITVW